MTGDTGWRCTTCGEVVVRVPVDTALDGLSNFNAGRLLARLILKLEDAHSCPPGHHLASFGPYRDELIELVCSHLWDED